MKLVYKCDFCHTFEESLEAMEKHESKCVFNPDNKRCFTCVNHVCDRWPDMIMYRCLIDNIDNDVMEGVEDGKVECEFYTKREN